LPNNPSNLPNISKILILVPQGAEYQAVVKNFNQNPSFLVYAIPIGCETGRRFLANLINPQQFTQVIVMGLCGSLNPDLKVGDIVIYRECQYPTPTNPKQTLPCTYIFNDNFFQLKKKTLSVNALTSDRLIHLAITKQNLYQTTNCDVVDMEGYVILEFFSKLNIPVGMIRVVSDASDRNLPNLEKAIDTKGNLQPLQLAIALIREPFAAINLITGSLTSLKVLAQILLVP
jgi:hypothetical protein